MCMTFLHAGGARQENWNRQREELRILRGAQNTNRKSEHFRKNSRSAIPKVNKAKLETLAFDLRTEWVTITKLDSKSSFSITICNLIAKEIQATVICQLSSQLPLS